MSGVESCLGDVLERLLGDLSESKQQELFECLASQGITTWQTFLLAHPQDLKQECMSSTLNIHTLRNILDLKDLVMTNFENDEPDAMLPSTYTKQMFIKHVFKLQLAERKKSHETKVTNTNDTIKLQLAERKESHETNITNTDDTQANVTNQEITTPTQAKY